MDTPTQRTTVTRQEAADMLGVSLRTLDRYIPAGSPGRTDYSDTPGKVQISLERVRELMPTPGGDDVAAD